MLKPIQDILNKQLLRNKPTYEQFSIFLEALLNLQNSILPNESEEHNKNYILEFLRNAFYGQSNLVNTAGSIDGAIYQTKDATSPIEVIIEAKAPNNQSEFPSLSNLNCKAMQELVLYFMRERFQNKNITLKHLIMTNGYEWFIIDATEFEKHFASDKNFVRNYDDWDNHKTIFSKTINFYNEIAKPKIDLVKQNINFAYIDIRTLKKESDKLKFFRILQPAHLLKQIKYADSNKLNTAFYNELLHIIGLEEHKVDGKSVIERKVAARRNAASLLESTMYQLDDYENITTDSERFDIALNLVITWINRILFLKLLESQLISYHGSKNSDQYRFLSPQIVKDYDELNELFFKVLALPVADRPIQVQEKFKNIPYLNSSLFELTPNEGKYFRITGLKLGLMPLFSHTVLKDLNGHNIQHELDTLEYLFCFLDAYDFGSEQSDEITKSENKTLINASVLGLIFEKINGYKDGSFFTPAFITQYMCQEAIERTVIRKFNEHFNWNCQTLTDIHNNDFDKQEAISLLDTITLCDPAVGSGHFLVSALNRLIAIRAELGLLYDHNGKRLKDYSISIENDELIVLDEEGEMFHYKPNNKESQRVQRTLFELKRNIIENNLFGADINPNSVNICRLRLWIELLKNAYYKDSNELETLPNIDINIKCGDSLKNKYPIAIGESINDLFLQKHIATYKQAVLDYKQTCNKLQKQTVRNSIEQIKNRIQNTDSQMNLFDANINNDVQKESQFAHSLEWMLEFPEVLDGEGKFSGFDIVIGNPPYIQLQTDGGKLAKLYEPNTSKKGDARNNYKTFTRTGDIYCLFYERGYQLLKPNGFLCFITSNKWMRAGYGEKTRQFLSTETTPNVLIDFAGVKVFENATVDTNILLFSKSISEQQQCMAVSCQNAKMDDIKNLSDFVRSNHTNIVFSTSESWIILSDIEQAIKRKIETIGVPLKEWDVQINYGIKTGCNDAFIITSEKRDEILSNCINQAERDRTTELIRPILRGRDIKRYSYDWAELYLISTFPARHYDIELYPSLKNYLLSLGIERLEQTGKTYNIDGNVIKARKKTNNQWFETQDSISYWDDFNKPKIIWKRVGSILRFSYDNKGILGLDSTCFATGDKIAYLCCVLNSPMGHFLLKDAPKTGTGDLLISVQAVEPIKIPQVQDSTLFVSFLQQYLEGDTNIENKINSTIYGIFGLSTKEIEYIEQHYC